MPTLTATIPNTYRDSIALMQHAQVLRELSGVEEAALVMATEGNLALLREAKILNDSLAVAPNDLAIVVRAKTQTAAEAAIARARALLGGSERSGSGADSTAQTLIPRSLGMLATTEAGAAEYSRLALISVPGEYAAAEAAKALAQGRHVMLFSDNVALADEVALKRFAAERRLMLMGPDCGTAIIDGVPLGFANRVRRGAIGCVAASGTGLQEVTTLIDRFGGGISQAIGTGGRDLAAEVGGRTMLAGIAALAADRATKVIVIISKPPAPEVAQRVIDAAAKTRKPVVVNFVGSEPAVKSARVHVVPTLEAAARAAVALAAGRKPPTRQAVPRRARVPRRQSSQRFVRGLFSGGTFCYEAAALLGPRLGSLAANASPRAEDKLDDPWQSRGHTLVDLGDDVFTRGRPHPMIDQSLRNARIQREAADPAVAVILFDVVLGLGAHADPAAAMAPALRAARAKARGAGRGITFVASICGTDADPQSRARQEAALRKEGVLIAPSNAQAALLAAAIVAPKGGGK